MNERSQRPATAATGLVLTLLVACGGAGSPSVRPPAPAFDQGAMLDVVSPDRITPLDDPAFEDPARATWLDDAARVLAIEHRGAARAYPLAIMLVHEVVNDEVGGVSVVVTFAPLCGAAIVYRRTLDDRARVFGASGKLYRADLVMFDRETTSLWSQLDGRAVLGDLAGSALEALPSQVMTLAEFRARYPSGGVLTRPATEDGRPLRTYDETAYRRYEAGTGPDPSLLPDALDERLGRMERVTGVRLGDRARAYPRDNLQRLGVINDVIGGRPVVVSWGERAGAAGVFSAEVDSRPARFTARGNAIVDSRTGSVWSDTGRAIAGPLKGATLEAVHHVDAFWFAWSAFHPLTDVWSAGPVG